MNDSSVEAQIAIDNAHIWHPYSAMHSNLPVFHVDSASGVYLNLSDGNQLIDGMSSWWCAIHGYNHPRLNAAVEQQLRSMAHVMFGGLTHEPAIRLVEQLLAITPQALQSVFICDSGSVAVEVAMKMAIQYWNARGEPGKQRFATLRNGYHGDTMGAMSVCDPVTGMHSLFSSVISQQLFVERPLSRFGESCSDSDIQPLEQLLQQNHSQIAALILEPVVQGAGGMHFYAAQYLTRARELCDRYDVLLIADEIATGFGRSGKMFACQHEAVIPDVMTLAKALGNGVPIGACVSKGTAAEVFKPGNHGSTFGGNPLASRAAYTVLASMLENHIADNAAQRGEQLSNLLRQGLADNKQVVEVRHLGLLMAIEMKIPCQAMVALALEQGLLINVTAERTIRLLPPLILSEAQTAEIASKLISCLHQFTE